MTQSRNDDKGADLEGLAAEICLLQTSGFAYAEAIREGASESSILVAERSVRDSSSRCRRFFELANKPAQTARIRAALNKLHKDFVRVNTEFDRRQQAAAASARESDEHRPICGGGSFSAAALVSVVVVLWRDKLLLGR